jgi:hypothetical protein
MSTERQNGGRRFTEDEVKDLLEQLLAIGGDRIKTYAASQKETVLKVGYGLVVAVIATVFSGAWGGAYYASTVLVSFNDGWRTNIEDPLKTASDDVSNVQSKVTTQVANFDNWKHDVAKTQERIDKELKVAEDQLRLIEASKDVVTKESIDRIANADKLAIQLNKDADLVQRVAGMDQRLTHLIGDMDWDALRHFKLHRDVIVTSTRIGASSLELRQSEKKGDHVLTLSPRGGHPYGDLSRGHPNNGLLKVMYDKDKDGKDIVWPLTVKTAE